MMNLIKRISANFPELNNELRVAHLNKTTYSFLRYVLINSMILAILLTILSFFILDKADLSKLLMIPIFVIIFFLLFKYFFLVLKVNIKKRERDIDREVLFAGRYLLVKIYSGEPLLNAIIDTSKSYGVAAKYFGEIVDEINLGTPIEKALENAIKFSPSEKFRKILFNIDNALKLGIDVTVPLESVLKEIEDEQIIEVKRYGKKLNAIVIFYLLFAVVVPSLGMTIFIVLSSFLNVSFGLMQFVAALFFLIILQLVFISFFKSIRPIINL